MRKKVDPQTNPKMAKMMEILRRSKGETSVPNAGIPQRGRPSGSVKHTTYLKPLNATVDEINTAFGLYVKSLREAREEGVFTICKALGLTKATIYNIESGRHGPHLSIALALCKRLGGSLDAFLQDFESKRPVKQQSSNAPQKKKLTKEQLEQILAHFDLDDLA